MRTPDVEVMVSRWLDGEDADVVGVDPELGWRFLTMAAARATTSRQFGRLAVSLSDFRVEHRALFFERLAAAAHEFPALVNVAVADDRRLKRAG